MGNIADLIGQKKRLVSEEEFDKKAEKFKGFDFLKEGRGGEWVEWVPREKARATPRPLLFKERMPLGATWEDWCSHPKMRNRPFVIFGAGASALELPLELLDGELVYGINWTLEWFQPTFLQLIDQDVAKSQIHENTLWEGIEKETQLVTSTWCAHKHTKGVESLNFKIHHATQSKEKKYEEHFATEPSEKMTWYANSLGYALNVACWFKPSRIVLVGFDFGGGHFFGDGRNRGARCHYGIAGSMKPHLLEQLSSLRDWVNAAGIPIRQVGPTNLELFDTTESLETAMWK